MFARGGASFQRQDAALATTGAVAPIRRGERSLWEARNWQRTRRDGDAFTVRKDGASRSPAQSYAKLMQRLQHPYQSNVQPLFWGPRGRASEGALFTEEGGRHGAQK